MSSGSGTTNATESARWVTRFRAARFGLNPCRSTAASASALTRLPPLIALDAVDRDTPAAAATSSRVGDARLPETGGSADGAVESANGAVESVVTSDTAGAADPADPAVAVVTVNSVGARPVQSSARAASVAVFRMSVICPLSRQQGVRRPCALAPPHWQPDDGAGSDRRGEPHQQSIGGGGGKVHTLLAARPTTPMPRTPLTILR